MAKAKKRKTPAKRKTPRRKATAAPWKPRSGITDPSKPDARLIAHYEWHGPDVKPKKEGIYQVANLSSYAYGWGYGKWNGKRWTRFRGYGGIDDDRGRADLWRGQPGNRQRPFAESDVR